MKNKNHIEISKFMSYVLRHKPESIGVVLDREGWVKIIDLIYFSNKEGWKLDQETIFTIVENSDKKRFSISSDGFRIRAVQGHSLPQVGIKYKEKILLSSSIMARQQNF